MSDLTLGCIWSVLELSGKADLQQLTRKGDCIQLGVFNLWDNCPEEYHGLKVVSVIAITSNTFNIIVRE